MVRGNAICIYDVFAFNDVIFIITGGLQTRLRILEDYE